jgi:hypothetical protein
VITFANQEALDLVLQKERIAGLREAAEIVFKACNERGIGPNDRDFLAGSIRQRTLTQSPDSGKG